MSNTTLPPVPTRTLRGANIADLVGLLQLQHRQKVDVVVPVSTLAMRGGLLQFPMLDPVVDESGVTDIAGQYRRTDTVDQQLGQLFDIPVRYVRTLADSYTELLDTNVNMWAEKEGESSKPRRVLVRMLYGQDDDHPGTNGLVRAILSSRYGIRDNLDTVLSVLDGMREGGLGADNIRGADLTDDRLWLRVHAPELAVNAGNLANGYRSPFTGQEAKDLPLVHAGIIVENSETGGGALKVTPELIMQVCMNGMKINTAAMRRVHLGTKLDEGQIKWSTATVDAANELTKQQIKDAVSSFMTKEFVESTVAKLNEAAGVEIEDPTQTVEVVAKKLSYSDEVAKGILGHFMASVVPTGGGLKYTAGHMMHAVTSYCQVIEDVDKANEVGATGVEAMLIAAGR
ncbi:hypothetical protein [Mycolicibacterium fortuitum]|uniref:Uncharacterized protein n=1 Tax=Mycobacterium phage Bipper TaxID=1805457 RepID=A0A142F2H7_9CAUD|nr:hypothetical protein [Mycolicibacterium fortuitum]YP_009303196.1 hypothetical protein KCH39_gp128 [Mycobacterium phage Bipper]AMQ66984.1 hypothetical protein SEA_BIPPER_49 [Mycobacterium phage Bipper]UBV18184.1 hypothetical protein H8Z57_16165 [Mycolicibacterium fortuitum]